MSPLATNRINVYYGENRWVFQNESYRVQIGARPIFTTCYWNRFDRLKEQLLTLARETINVPNIEFYADVKQKYNKPDIRRINGHSTSSD